MVRKIVLFLLVFTLSFQSLSVTLSVEKPHTGQSFTHDALHFWGEPHSHDVEDPGQILLEFSAEARHHVAHDLGCCIAALFQHYSLKNSPVLSTPDVLAIQFLSEPYLHRVTPPPRA